MKTPMKITLPVSDRKILEGWLKSRSSSITTKHKFRANIILMTASNKQTQEIMKTLKTTNLTLNLWMSLKIRVNIPENGKAAGKSPSLVLHNRGCNPQREPTTLTISQLKRHPVQGFASRETPLHKTLLLL